MDIVLFYYINNMKMGQLRRHKYAMTTVIVYNQTKIKLKRTLVLST